MEANNLNVNNQIKIISSETSKFNNNLNLNYTYLKKRNFGIDLLKIFSMINVLNLHINLCSNLLSKNPNSSEFKQVFLLESFSYFAVDCFGLMSGIVGYKKYKFSNLIYIWFVYCFYSFNISLY